MWRRSNVGSHWGSSGRTRAPHHQQRCWRRGYESETGGLTVTPTFTIRLCKRPPPISPSPSRRCHQTKARGWGQPTRPPDEYSGVGVSPASQLADRLEGYPMRAGETETRASGAGLKEAARRDSGARAYAARGGTADWAACLVPLFTGRSSARGG